MQKQLIIGFSLVALFLSCENNSDKLSDFSVNIISKSETKSVVGTGILCELNVEGINEGADDVSAFYSIDEGVGDIFINEKCFNENQELDFDFYNKTNFPFIYLPKSEGNHTLNFFIRKQLKEQIIEHTATINLNVLGLRAKITNLESEVLVGNTTRFHLLINVDMAVYCEAIFLKGEGLIEIANSDVVDNMILLQKDNEVSLIPKSVGECRVEFKISGAYGQPIRSIVVIDVVN